MAQVDPNTHDNAVTELHIIIVSVALEERATPEDLTRGTQAIYTLTLALVVGDRADGKYSWRNSTWR